jgi:endo-alpha-1,4-polygalactosaminidase (GH114 family)
MRSADARQLSDLGVVTLGYLSIGEDPKLHDGNGQGPSGKASWYFDSDSDRLPDQDPIWKSWYTNANDRAWRANRVSEAKRLVNEYGFDGIFLDLVSVCELYPESRGGMLQLIQDLRLALPEAVIVMNQGFNILADAAPIVDGIMIESFTATYDFDLKQYVLNDPASLDFHLQRAVKVLQPVLRKHPLRVLVLDYAKATDAKTIQFAANRAASLGFLFSVSPILLDDVYVAPPAGESDEKWLRAHTTREGLSIKLTEARNGFSAGTIVAPSGNYAGYTVEPLLDSETDRSTGHWRKSSWASSEDGEPAWVEFTLPTAREGGILSIWWYDQAGPSRRFSVEVRDDPSSQWQVVESLVDNMSRNSKIQLPRERFRQIRVVQPPNGGSAGRPNLMWITKVELTSS